MGIVLKSSQRDDVCLIKIKNKMKKYFRYMMVAIAAIVTVGLVSCSKDDEDENGGAPVSKEDLVGEWIYNVEKSVVDMKINGQSTTAEMAEQMNFMQSIQGDVTFGSNDSFSCSTDKEGIEGSYSVSGNQLELVYSYLDQSITMKSGANLNSIIAANPDMAQYADMMDFKVKDLSVRIDGDVLFITTVMESSVNMDLSEMGDLGELNGLVNLLPEGGMTISGKIVTAYDRKK